MTGNFEVLIRIFEKDPDRFFKEWLRSIKDGTIAEDDNQRLIEKMEKIQPVNYTVLCRILKLNPTSLEHKILCHHLAMLGGRGDLDDILK